MPQLAGQAKAAAVRFYNRLADRQSHTRAMNLYALIASPVELFKDEGLFEVVNAGAAVGDADGEHAWLVRDRIARFGGDADGSTGGRILGRIFEQVNKNFSYMRRVHASRGKISGDADIDGMLAQELL